MGSKSNDQVDRQTEDSPEAPEYLRADSSDDSLVDAQGRTLAWLIRDVSRLYTVVGQKTLAPKGITMAHWYYLRVLEEGPLVQLELSRRVGMASTTAVPALDFLEKNELLVRSRDPNDRRKYIVSLTDKGRDLISEVMEIFAGVLRDSLKGASKGEVVILWKTLSLLESNLSSLDACSPDQQTGISEELG